MMARNSLPTVLFPLLVGLSTGCLDPSFPPWDEDGDGYGRPDDCAPDDPSIHVNARELCDDGVDNDCDGEVDGWDPQCHQVSTSDGWSMVSAGPRASCGILDDEIVCWGIHSLAAAPAGTFREVSMGMVHASALSSAGGVHVWTDPALCEFLDVCVPPEGAFVQVVSGRFFSCALAADGFATCWGGAMLSAESIKDVPETPMNKISASECACGLLDGGDVLCWGCPVYLESFCASSPEVPLIDLSVGPRHACGLTEEFHLSCWGEVAFDVPEGSFTAVSTSHYQTCAIRPDETLVCFGGEGVDELEAEFGPNQAPTGTFSQVSVSDYHTCGLATDGRVRCWGDNLFGHVNPP